MNQTRDDALLIQPQTLNRWPYFWLGCALMAVKYNLDRLIAWQGFHRSWYLWNYIKPHGDGSIDALPPTDERFYFILLLTSLPFLLVGILLTLRRLRSAGVAVRPLRSFLRSRHQPDLLCGSQRHAGEISNPNRDAR